MTSAIFQNCQDQIRLHSSGAPLERCFAYHIERQISFLIDSLSYGLSMIGLFSPCSVMYSSDPLHSYYTSIIAQDILLKTSVQSLYELPRLEKIVLNSTSRQYVADRKFGLAALLGLELLSGQKAAYTCAKKSVASFKLRQHQFLGSKVTLRRRNLSRFFHLLIALYLPRIRDISPPKSQFGLLSISFGLTNMLMFPQLENHFDSFQNFRGCTATVVTRCSHPSHIQSFLSAYQFPIH